MGMLQEKQNKKETEKMLTQVDRKFQYEYWSGEGAFPILAVVTASRTLCLQVRHVRFTLKQPDSWSNTVDAWMWLGYLIHWMSLWMSEAEAEAYLPQWKQRVLQTRKET